MTRVFYKGRFIGAVALLFLVLTGLGTRLAFLHFGAVDRAKLVGLRSLEREMKGQRGKILDRRGEPYLLASDIMLKNIGFDPEAIRSYIVKGHEDDPDFHMRTVARDLAPILGVTEQSLLKKLNRDTRYVRLVKKAQPELSQAVAELGHFGITFEEVSVRHYPHEDFLCHVVGYSNHEGVGSAGVEQRLDEYLRPVAGYVAGVKNARDREMRHRRAEHVLAKNGANIELTIDQYVQDAVERAMDKVMEEHSAEGAWAIVQKVHTGEILAMASRPSYNLNTFYRAAAEDRLNRAIGVNFDPGSTLKVITFAEVLDRGLVNRKTMINCENGMAMFGGRPLRDYHPYGLLTMEDCLKKSSNIATAKLAQMLGRKELYETFKKYQMGNRLGVGLPGEEAGVARHHSKWDALSLSRMSIGQGITTTALQVLNVYCTVANQGVMMKPYVLRRVVDENGKVLVQNRPEIMGRPMKPSTAATMCQMLARVTEKGGTGRRARIDGYKVAGKTGTAQKVVNGRYSESEHVASFVGFVPALEPQLGIIVVVDNPQPIHVGGVVAAPAFKEIAEMAVRYLDIPPSVDVIAREADLALAP